MTLPIVILGGGGHARVVAEALRAAGHVVVGYVARSRTPGFSSVLSHLGTDAALGGAGLRPADVALANGIGPRPREGRELRAALHHALKRRGFAFATVLHPAATVAGGVVLEEGCQVMAGAVVQPGVRLGVGAVVNTRAVVDHDGTVGAHAHVAPGAVLCGAVRVGDEAFVGASATIVPRVVVGRGALVAAGALVRRNVAAGACVMGVPARVCGRR